MTEFCEHLEDYGVQYQRAEEAYGALLAQLERVAAGEAGEDALDRLEQLMDDWCDEVRILRRRMVEMVRRGRAEPPAAAGEGVSCVLCGMVLPRLVFTDFAVSDEGTASYRGLPLAAPAPAAV